MSATPKFGERVSCHSFLRRDIVYGERGYCAKKVWTSIPIGTREGVFLGFRNLSNGTRSYDSEEGYGYKPTERFKAALVCFSEKENPVLVPLDSITKP